VIAATTTLHVSIHYLVILPVLILFGASLLLLIASAMWRRTVPTVVTTTTTVAASVAVLVVTYFQWRCLDKSGASTTVAHAVVLDGFSVVATAVIAISVALAALVAHDWARREGVRGAEYSILALASSAGAVLMTQANDLVVIFLGLEILSLGLYVLVAIDRRKRESAEAALKYFILGGFASAIFIYGVALVYGATGSTNISSISYFLGSNVVLHPGLLYAGGAMLLVGFAFKIAAVPFHMWSPDVYEGAPTPVTGFMASIVKVGAFAALLRVMISGLGTQLATWRPIFWVLIVATTVVGALLALPQRNAKRLLAYSSINHAGFILVGVWAGTARGSAATLFYLATYAPTVVATFAIVTLVGGLGDERHSLQSYRGLARRQPWLGASLAVLLLSQLGAPLTAGFYAKYSVLAAAVASGGTVLALVALLSAAIAASFYLRWTVVLYADPDDDVDASRVVVPRATGVVIVCGVVLTLVFGIWPGPLATLAQHATLLFTP
jgi:NADH-quinone oxidoreductase subunit N